MIVLAPGLFACGVVLFIVFVYMYARGMLTPLGNDVPKDIKDPEVVQLEQRLDDAEERAVLAESVVTRADPNILQTASITNLNSNNVSVKYLAASNKNHDLLRQIEELKRLLAQCRAENATLKAALNACRAELARQIARNKYLEEENARLRKCCERPPVLEEEEQEMRICRHVPAYDAWRAPGMPKNVKRRYRCGVTPFDCVERCALPGGGV